MLHGKSQMYIFTKPDGRQSAPRNIQLCSYFSLFISLPSLKDYVVEEKGGNIFWSKEDILNQDFIQQVVNTHIPEGIDTEVKCWRMHFRKENTTDNDDIMAFLVAEYRIGLFGERIPITANDATNYKRLIEDEVQRMASETRKGAWDVSNVVSRTLIN